MSSFIKIDDVSIPGDRDEIYMSYRAVKACINHLAASPGSQSEVVNFTLKTEDGATEMFAVRLTAATRLSVFFDDMDGAPLFLEKAQEQSRAFLGHWLAVAEKEDAEGEPSE